MQTLGFWCLTVLLAVTVHAQEPGEVLDLGHWMLTLPVDTQRAGKPDEVLPPELQRWSDPQHFFVTSDGRGVVCRAECGGRTTKGSKFPRTELREMDHRGHGRAAWSTTDTVKHTLTARLAITQTPTAKPHVVCAQIHDAEDDLLMIRLEGQRLFIERNDVGDVPLNNAYQLGEVIDLKITAGQGRVQVWYAQQLKLDWSVERSGCYFKAGCYTQSNVQRGDKAEAYGEVTIYHLDIDHE